jgi:hypothetical protein
MSVFGCVIYNGEGGLGKQTSRSLLRNKIEKKETPPTQSTNQNSSNDSNPVLTVLLVIAGIVVLGLGVGMGFLYYRHKKYVKRTEEEKTRKNENWVKDGGVEMVEKHYVWSPDVIGGPMGQLSVNIEDEKEKEENCSSSAALLGPERETKDEKSVAQNCEKKEEEKKEEEEEVAVPFCPGNTTTTLTFLVDGLSCVEPFEKEIVDQRDTLLSFILSKHEHLYYSERMRNAINFCVKIIPLVFYILSMGEYGFEWLIGFGPIGIVKCGDENYVIVYHNGLLENGGIIGEKERFKSELGRWKSPEILKGEVSRETEKSCVFTMGMIIYTILMRKKPFHKENDESAMGKIISGERPDLSSSEKKKRGFVSIVRDCWCDDWDERLLLMELRDNVIDLRCD